MFLEIKYIEINRLRFKRPGINSDYSLDTDKQLAVSQNHFIPSKQRKCCFIPCN